MGLAKILCRGGTVESSGWQNELLATGLPVSSGRLVPTVARKQSDNAMLPPTDMEWYIRHNIWR